MKRSVCTILIVAILVLPAGSLGVAQESRPDLAASDWSPVGEPGGIEAGDAAEYEPWVPPLRTGPAAVITVTTTDDELNGDGDCSLREAIEAANTDAVVDACAAGSGDDTLIVPSGTYTLTIPGAGEDNNQTGDLDILDNLVLNGDGADTTILDGNQLDRGLHILPGRTVEINEVTVTHGFLEDMSGAGIRNEGGTLTLNDVILRENQVTRVLSGVGGGGFHNVGIYQDATATLNNCLVVENSAWGGGGIANSVLAGLTAIVTLNHTTVSSNTAESSGGGIWHTYGGGATNAWSILNLHNSVVDGNMAYHAGGGILTLGNPADNMITMLTVDRSTIHGNAAISSGGGLGNGGGIVVERGTLTAVDSTVSDNSSSGTGFQTGLGGGLLLLDSQTTMVNSTVSGNEASGSGLPDLSGGGGGIAIAGRTIETSLTLTNTSVVSNTSNVVGGGIANVRAGAVTATSFKNSLIAGNSALMGESCFNGDVGFGQGTLTSLGHNLEDHNRCELDQPTDLPNTDPLLGPLADNGGPTWTHALLAGSPAIDAGDDAAAPPTDQRGVPRPQGPASDIGAFEANILVNTCDDELNGDGDCSLREAIEAANTDAAVDACMAGSGHDYLTLPACTYLLAIPGAGEDGNQTGDLDILDDLTIYGAAADTAVIDADQLDRVLHILPGRTVEINDVTISHGFLEDMNGAGILNEGGTLTLNDAILRENQVTHVQLNVGGGGLANAGIDQDATATLNNCLVVENSAWGGGGILNTVDAGLTSTLTLSHTTVTSNTAETSGGGIWGAYYAGATNASSILNLHNSVVEGNAAGGLGGGIDTVGNPPNNMITMLTVNNSRVSDNTATATSTNSGAGGGVYTTRSTVTVVDSAIHDNTAVCVGFTICGNGGGLFLNQSAALIEASTIRNNSSSGAGFQTGLGGGLFLWNGQATMVNSTVSGNEASGSGVPDFSGAGGGIVVAGTAIETSLTLTNTSVVSNTSNVLGGGIANVRAGADAVTTFKNSLVAGNSAPAGMGESCFNPDVGFGPGILDSLGNNLEDHDTCEFDQPTDQPNTDPLLGPLADNGGPTWTHALLAGSPAIDAGDDDAAPPTDQRGVPRPQGPASDIGSFEAYDENPPTVVAVSPPDGAVDVAVDASLVITFSEPVSAPTFAYTVSPDPGGWTESWGPDDTAVTLTHDVFAPGATYSATVTAAEDRAGNPLTELYAWSFTTELCDPVEMVSVEGPAILLVGETAVYSATYAPLTATLPVTFMWGDGTVGATANYSWTLPGTYTLTVTATNPCSEVSNTFTLAVSRESYRVYVPVIMRGSQQQ